MDPDAVWQRVLENMAKLNRQLPRNDTVIALGYDIHSLGEWFSRGGFAPNKTTTAHPQPCRRIG